MDAIQAEFDRLTKKSNLGRALSDIDAAIALVQQARDQIAQDPSNHALAMARLQQAMPAAMDKVGQDQKEFYTALNKYGKALDKKFKGASSYSSTDYDALSNDTALLNRAVAMHLIREGQFSVASTFLDEAAASPSAADSAPLEIPPHLQAEFHNMYTILSSLRAGDLALAIAWASMHSADLSARGSNLEFDLVRLQFTQYFLSDEGGGRGRARALIYGQREFSRFYSKHGKEIERLMTAFLFRGASSPYHATLHAPEASLAAVAQSFTKEFCSLLGLSASSPLYVAATAGAIALPTLLKMTSIMKEKRTEWTTQNELPVEIPLPAEFRYHSVFVCPVSKDQTTDDNPPMILPCGHVIALESLQRLAKGGSSVSLKCPYCPRECTMHQAKMVII